MIDDFSYFEETVLTINTFENSEQEGTPFTSVYLVGLDSDAMLPEVVCDCVAKIVKSVMPKRLQGQTMNQRKALTYLRFEETRNSTDLFPRIIAYRIFLMFCIGRTGSASIALVQANNKGP